MTESRDCLTGANKYNAESLELQTENLPETRSMCLMHISVALACGWVVVRLHVLLPFGMRAAWLGHLRGPPGVTDGRMAPEAWSLGREGLAAA